MIAMQYTIRLAADFEGERVHNRVRQRSRLFDDLPGLLHKSFLYNEAEGLYAPFYVWECDAPARSFLLGDLFRDLVQTFGRPRVRCWSVLSFWHGDIPCGGDVAVKEVDSIPAEIGMADLAKTETSRHEAAQNGDGIGCHLVGIDPDRWELMRYSTWRNGKAPIAYDADMTEHYEILHLSRPVATG